MMTVPPVNALPPVSPVSPAESSAPAAAASPASAPTSAPDHALVERFNAIMHRLETSPQQHVHSHEPSAIGQFVSQQDHEFQAVMDDVRNFSVSDPNNLQQMAQEIIHMQSELTALSFKMNIGTALAQSGKGSIQTLMKNQ
ncbi:MAG TPA: type III secretion protein HrpB2 [Burkholderiaceae bacterium]